MGIIYILNWFLLFFYYFEIIKVVLFGEKDIDSICINRGIKFILMIGVFVRIFFSFK